MYVLGEGEHLSRITGLLAEKKGWGMTLGRGHMVSAAVFEIFCNSFHYIPHIREIRPTAVRGAGSKGWWLMKKVKD